MEGGRTLPFLYPLLLIGVVLLSLLLAAIWMRPPIEDMLQLALIFGVTGLISTGVGTLTHRLGWWRGMSTLSRSLILSHGIAALLTFATVWVAARLMFINQHDLALARLLLIFAGGISVSFGYLISRSITRQLRDLSRGAEQLSHGDFSVRVDSSGEDEVGRLARAFNQMASRLQEAEAKATRLEHARNEFIVSVSHDLRTPLASIRAMLHALQDGVVEDTKDAQRYLEQSQKQIAHMSSVIDDLVELARIEAGIPQMDMRSASIQGVIEETVEGLSFRAQDKGVALSSEVEPGIGPLIIAPDKIGRVLYNLLDNALRHTPAGGRIVVRAVSTPGWVTIEVLDNGSGIPEEDLPFIFERFFRGERSRNREGYREGGVGLGLAIAKGLVEAHAGGIKVESEEGEGTRVVFRLPREEGDKGMEGDHHGESQEDSAPV